MQGTCCFAWGVILTDGEIGVLSVSSLFLNGAQLTAGALLWPRPGRRECHPVRRLWARGDARPAAPARARLRVVHARTQ